MSLESDGWEDIQKTIDSLGDVGKKINTTAFKNSLKEGLKIVQDKAPKAKDGSTNGAEKLRVGKIKRYKSGSIWGGVGIDKTNWEATKHLYFHHYGYEHYKSGKKVTPHTGWMDEATKASESVVLGSLEKNILAELDKILK